MAAIARNANEVELALCRVAQGVHNEMYKGVKLPQYEPQRKTLVHDAWHGKNLSERHQRAWAITMHLFREACGISPPNMMFSERIGGGDGGLPVPRSGNNYAQDRIEFLRDYKLHRHEWSLLLRLTIEHFQNTKHGTLADLGKKLSGYGDTAQSRAAGVTSMQRLFDSLCEFHGI